MNYDFRVTLPVIHSLGAALQHIENAQLVRKLADLDAAYLFKHALVQDSAYGSLTRHERKRLHLRVAATLERLSADALDENAALLAYHFERAEEWDKTLAYLQRAAEWARQSAAHLEQAALLARAIAIAEQQARSTLLPGLHARRGKAFTSLTRWQEAKTELLAALNLLPPEQIAARSEMLVELAKITEWLFDSERAKQYAGQALGLAEQVGRDDLAASAMTTLASIESSDGHPHAAVEYYERAFARAGNLRSALLVEGVAYSSLIHHFVGNTNAAVERAGEAVRLAREMSDSAMTVFALGNLGLALSARGDYGQALETLRQGEAFAQSHGVMVFLARTLVIAGGAHLDLYDFAGAQALAERARELARAVKFPAAAVSAAIDLLLNLAQRGEFNGVPYLEREIANAIPHAHGNHRWLWEMRYAFARAELARARGKSDTTRVFCEQAIEKSRAVGRRKYECLALLTRANARRIQEPDAALADARAAFTLAQALNEPALILRAAIENLAFQENESLRAAARQARAKILASLSESPLRERFHAVTSEWF